MARLIDAILSLKDNFSATLEKANSNLNKFNKQYARVAKQIERTGDSLKSAGKSLTTNVTLPIVGIGAAATKMSIDFSDGVAKVSTILDKNQMSINTMRQSLLTLSNDTGKSATEMADAMYEVLSAGVQTKDSVKFLEVATKAAKGGFTDTKTSVDGLTTVLNSYGIEASNAGKIANQLMVAQNLGKTTFGDMASYMGNVTPIAATLNVQTQELFSSIASLTSQGIKTSESVTGLKAAFSNIVKPSADAAKIANQLGINFSSSHLKSVGWGKFLEEIKQKTGGNQDKMAQLFGSVDALNTVLALTSNSGMKLYNQAMDQMGSNTDYVQQAINDLNTPGEKLRTSLNKISNAGIKLGDSLASSLEKISGIISKLADKFSSLSPAQQDFLIKAAMIAAAIGPVVMVVGGLTSGIGGAIGVVNKFSKAVKAVGLISAIATPGMIVLLVILAIAGAAFLIIKYWKPISAFFINLWTQVYTRFKKPIDMIVGIFRALFAICKGVFSIIYLVISVYIGLWIIVITKFISIAVAIWDKIKNPVIAVFSFIGGIIKGYINIWIDLLNLLIVGLNKIHFKIPDWVPGGMGGKAVGFNVPLIPKLALGTMNWPGGIAQVSERGGEIIDLPRGSRVYPHEESIRKARQQGQAEGGINIYIPKLADTLIVREEADIQEIAKAFAFEISKNNINFSMGGVA